MTLVTLYGKAGCHLCEEARASVLALRDTFAFELEEVDVSLDPALAREYGERIPVVAIDGDEVAELVVDTEIVRARLATRER